MFDSQKARDELAKYLRAGPGVTTRGLLAGLQAANASGTLLDIGSGSGTLTFELLAEAVSSATCVDLAPGSIAVAREEAARREVTNRISWHQGDFVEIATQVPAADIVTLDRVVCCYPWYRPLLENAAAHSRRWLALSYPRDRWYVRCGLWLENFWRRLRHDGFRAFVHPVHAMDDLLRSAGFVPIRHSTSFIWQSSVYARRTT
jgi:magnesium-protoporphyrin O-methyltransferase